MPSAGHHFLKYNQTHKANNFFHFAKECIIGKKASDVFTAKSTGKIRRSRDYTGTEQIMEKQYLFFSTQLGPICDGVIKV